MVKLLTIAIALLLCGCELESKRTAARIKGGGTSALALPPLPPNSLPRARAVPKVAKALEGRTIALSWSNQPVQFPALYESVVCASAQLRDWREVAVVPYAVAGGVRLTNRPECEFYRVGNRIKGDS